MAPPRWGYRPGIQGEIDEYFETPELLVPKRSRRRHNREMKIRQRMKFVIECMFVYQPGIKYGDIEQGYSDPICTWFKPGRFAKIHPRRVCSCEMCQEHYTKRDRRKAAEALRRELLDL